MSPSHRFSSCGVPGAQGSPSWDGGNLSESQLDGADFRGATYRSEAAWAERFTPIDAERFRSSPSPVPPYPIAARQVSMHQPEVDVAVDGRRSAVHRRSR